MRAFGEQLSAISRTRRSEIAVDAVLAALFVGSTFVMTVLVALAIMCCGNATSPASSFDRDGTGTPLGAACETLRLYGCPEGQPGAGGETCFEHLGRASSVAVVPADCVADAGSAAIVRECGSANTITFRCRIDGGTP